jgi:hypothetical protein
VDLVLYGKRNTVGLNKGNTFPIEFLCTLKRENKLDYKSRRISVHDQPLHAFTELCIAKYTQTSAPVRFYL